MPQATLQHPAHVKLQVTMRLHKGMVFFLPFKLRWFRRSLFGNEVEGLCLNVTGPQQTDAPKATSGQKLFLKQFKENLWMTSEAVCWLGGLFSH